MAIYGRQVGTLFLGTLRPSTRAYLQQFFARARRRGYTRFVEPACGALAMSQLAVKAGFAPGRIEASDVTLFSTLMGYGIMGRRERAGWSGSSFSWMNRASPGRRWRPRSWPTTTSWGSATSR